MKFDLDNAINQMTGDPWDLSLTIGGTAYATKPLEVGAMQSLATIERVSGEQQITRVTALFADPAPPVASWTPEQRSGAVAAVVAYQQVRSQKKLRAIASAVGAQAMAEMK